MVQTGMHDHELRAVLGTLQILWGW